MKILKIKIILSLLILICLVAGIFLFTVYKTETYGITEEISSQKISIEEDDEVKLTEEELEVLDLINDYREQNGLEKLKPYSKLQETAKIKAEDIVDNNYFAHTSEKYGTPFDLMKDNEVKYKIAGENLAGNISPKKAVEAWINSPSHKSNILEKKFEYTGICVINSPIYGKVFVQMFIGI